MAEAVVGLIDEIIKKYRIDPDRVYLSGLSMGGKGTWLVAEAAPDRFAAIAPISAVAVLPDKAGRASSLHPDVDHLRRDDGGFTDGVEADGRGHQSRRRPGAADRASPTRATASGAAITPSPNSTSGCLNKSETAPPPPAPRQPRSWRGDRCDAATEARAGL